MVRTNNLKVSAVKPLIAPADLKQVLPLSEKAAGFVAASREQIQDVLWNRDPRMMVVVGPCSIHDPKAALEYAERLAKLNEMRDRLATKLADPALYEDARKGELETWNKKYAEVMDGLDRAEAMWLSAQEKLDAAG